MGNPNQSNTDATATDPRWHDGGPNPAMSYPDTAPVELPGVTGAIEEVGRLPDCTSPAGIKLVGP